MEQQETRGRLLAVVEEASKRTSQQNPSQHSQSSDPCKKPSTIATSSEAQDKDKNKKKLESWTAANEMAEPPLGCLSTPIFWGMLVGHTG